MCIRLRVKEFNLMLQVMVNFEAVAVEDETNFKVEAVEDVVPVRFKDLYDSTIKMEQDFNTIKVVNLFHRFHNHFTNF